MNFKLYYAHVLLRYFRFRRLLLGLKIGIVALKCSVFGLNENKKQINDRALARQVDRLLERFK